MDNHKGNTGNYSFLSETWMIRIIGYAESRNVVPYRPVPFANRHNLVYLWKLDLRLPWSDFDAGRLDPPWFNTGGVPSPSGVGSYQVLWVDSTLHSCQRCDNCVDQQLAQTESNLANSFSSMFRWMVIQRRFCVVPPLGGCSHWAQCQSSTNGRLTIDQNDYVGWIMLQPSIRLQFHQYLCLNTMVYSEIPHDSVRVAFKHTFALTPETIFEPSVKNSVP